jgi:hypothetical protein
MGILVLVAVVVILLALFELAAITRGVDSRERFDDVHRGVRAGR